MSQSIIAFVLLLVALVNSASALNCTSCEFSPDWDTCRAQGKIMECTLKQVNRYHGDMRDNNPTLVQLDADESTEDVTFSCFAMELKSKDGDVSQRGVISGCTFKRQQICEGWTGKTAVTRCGICESEQICSSANSAEVASKFALISAVLVIANVFR